MSTPPMVAAAASAARRHDCDYEQMVVVSSGNCGAVSAMVGRWAGGRRGCAQAVSRKGGGWSGGCGGAVLGRRRRTFGYRPPIVFSN